MNLSIARLLTIQFLCAIFLPTVSLCAFSGNAWSSIGNEHFTVSYNQRTVDLAQFALQYAEDTRISLSKYFGADFGTKKIAIALSDDNDYGNGAAYYEVPLVRIDCRKTQNFFRGETEWMRTVLSHELSHLYSFNVIKKGIHVYTLVLQLTISMLV